MEHLPSHIIKAIEAAVAEDPALSADELMAQLGAAITDAEGRQALRRTHLAASIKFAKNERGANATIDEAFGAARDAIAKISET